MIIAGFQQVCGTLGVQGAYGGEHCIKMSMAARAVRKMRVIVRK